jgi:hypothetical protein
MSLRLEVYFGSLLAALQGLSALIVGLGFELVASAPSSSNSACSLPRVCVRLYIS